MIYQCYFNKSQKTNLFQSPVYQGFGLEPEVNPDIFIRCPELEDPVVRLQLCEYACFLWHWRNPDANPDSWFGTTSYRQLDKFDNVFHNPKAIIRVTEKNSIASWGIRNLVTTDKVPITLAQHTDSCHPGMNKFIAHVFSNYSLELPDDWYAETKGVFANYWAMNRELFHSFMNFSWPLVRYALNDKYSCKNMTDKKPFIQRNEKIAGYFAERLFILWYLKEGIPFENIGVIKNNIVSI